MELRLLNINKIKSATIQLGGLTVIAGDNDSGKSTVGKVLFSMIKALSKQSEYLTDDKVKKIRYLVEQIYFINRVGNISAANSEEFRDLFYPPKFIKELEQYMTIMPNSDIEMLELNNLILIKKDYISNSKFTIAKKARISGYLDEIYKCCSESVNPIQGFSDILKKTLYSEFYSKVCTDSTDSSKIELKFNDRDEVTLELNDNKIVNINADNILSHPFQLLEDITFIETPLYLQLIHLIEQAGVLFDDKEAGVHRFRPKVPLHIKDLVKKLELARYSNNNDNEYISFIESIVGGKFKYDNKSNNLLFEKNDGYTLSTSNVASGIKSFGIIQLLLQVQELNERKMLIIDEPENHLHPKWQLCFAHLIVRLIKNGISIVISSHSPYFIQAVKYYSIKEEVAEKVNYYLADTDIENTQMTNITDVTDDMNRIFVKLADPLNEILGV